MNKEKITQEQADAQLEEITGRITGTTDYEGFGDVDFVVEAVPERMEIKQAVFGELDAVTPGHAILASNTSSLSITEMARGHRAPRQGRGLPLLLPGLDDAADRGDRGRGDLRGDAPGHHQLRPADPQDRRSAAARRPGFVVNRILNSAVSEVWRVTDEEGLDVKEVDKVIQESKAAPMGPFFLADLLGLDTVLHVAEHLHDSYGDRFYVSPTMKELVEAGQPRPEDRKGLL